MRTRLIALALALGLVPAMVSAQATYSANTVFPNPFLSMPGTTFTGPILLPDGTAAAPSIGFSSGASIGFYKIGTSLNITFGGRTYIFGATGFSLFDDNIPIYMGAAQDVVIRRDAANTLALRNDGTAGAPVPQTFNVYNFCDGAACATGYERAAIGWVSSEFRIAVSGAGTGVATRSLALSAQNILLRNGISFEPDSSDTWTLGATPRPFSTLQLSRSIQGSKSKALTDAATIDIWTAGVADDDYEACEIGWTAYAEDTATDERQVRKGKTQVAILNNSGTGSCGISSAAASTEAVNVTSGTLSCSWFCVDAVDAVTIQANCDSTLAATTTFTMESRLNCESTVTLTPIP